MEIWKKQGYSSYEEMQLDIEVDSMTDEEYYNTIVDLNLLSADELNIVTSINGFNKKVMNDCIYYKTGFRNLFQLLTALKDI